MAREGADSDGRHGKHRRLLTEPVRLDLLVCQGRLELLGVELQADLLALVCAQQILRGGRAPGHRGRLHSSVGSHPWR